MTAKELFRAGHLTEAIQALGAELRENPTDAQRRTFLFELLCFAGDFDRAEKQLNVLADSSQETQMGAVLYHSALHAERLRQDLFSKRDWPDSSDPEPRAGTLNGKPFASLEDSDPRVGARLELFAAGAYLWIPFEHITAIEMEKPKRLRDLLWIPALVRTGPSFRGTELGEVLLPVVSPFSWRHADGNVALGRKTEWMEDETGEMVPFGQKTFLVDDDDIAILEVRKLEFASAETAEAAADASP